MDPDQPMTAAPETVDALVEGRCPIPFDTLGIHRLPGDRGSGLVVRALLPWAVEAAVDHGGRRAQMQRVHPGGLFEARFPGETTFFGYRLAVRAPGGHELLLEDPYRFLPILTEADLDAFVTGGEVRLDRLLGAHPTIHQGVRGTRFSVWAPNAAAAGVMGTFNSWDARCHPMRPVGISGVWELFIPGVGAGALYKYEIVTHHHGKRAIKADPCGYAMELRPNTASVVCGENAYAWGDRDWLTRRARRQTSESALSIYEVHLGSWRRRSSQSSATGWLNYRELADELVPYAKEMGFTHLQFLPATEHPFDGSWGYQTVGYFAPTSRYGSPDDFRHLIDRAHQAGLGVILDWVPAHFPRDEHGLCFFDGTHLYEHADPRQGAHPDWGTLIYNYGRPQVTAFLISSALFWIDEYHIDGLRLDAVASMLYLDYSRAEGEWIPNRFGGRENLEAVEFLRRLNDTVHTRYPEVLMIAEESTSWPRVTGSTETGGLGFDLKWNMGWMHDTLVYMSSDPLFRQGLQDKLTFSIYYAFNERFLLPLSHDEVVHGKSSLLGKMPGSPDAKFANQRLLFGYMFGHPGKKLLFMGAEIGQWREWNFDRQLDWDLLQHAPHQGLQRWIRALNRVYAREPALRELDFAWQGFEWIDPSDAARSVASFVRWSAARDELVVVVANFTPVLRREYRVGVPEAGVYRLLLNSDATEFGGGGEPVGEGLETRGVPAHGHDQSLELTLPPLSILYLKPEHVQPA